MSDKTLPSDVRNAVREAYADNHATTRLRHWRVDDNSQPSALLYLSKTGKLREVLREASGPILQGIENAERFDSSFNKLTDGAVDNILSKVVCDKQIGTMRRDTLGYPVFKPWSNAASPPSPPLGDQTGVYAGADR